jgi:Abortive infection C-terminus
MKQKIPAIVINTCSEIIAERETHDSLDSLFLYAGAPGDPPKANKKVKALTWIRRVNSDNDINPLEFLGRLIESYMEESLDPSDQFEKEKIDGRNKIIHALNQYDLKYVKGGVITGQLIAPSKDLINLIKDLNVEALTTEFERALINVNKSPRESVSAASNILESICKIYISEEKLTPPQKQDLKSIWSVVRKHLGCDPQSIEDKDLQQILSGLISIADGVSSLRTHASSAHGAGKKSYKIESRHARLAVHSAHTIALFILETWQKKI